MPPTHGLKRALLGRLRSAWRIATHTYYDVIDNELLTRASAIAFGAMMAAVPFLALVFTIAALVLPATSLDGKDLLHALEALLGTVFPDEAHRVIEEQIARLHGGQPIAVLSISLAITIWLASGLYAGVIDGLNRIYGVRDRRPYWRFRLTAIWMTIVQSVILLGAVGAIFALPSVINLVGVTIPQPWMATGVTWFIIFVMVLVSFALTFAAGPDVKQAHRWVTPGSLFGATVFVATTYVFRLYVQNLAHYDLTYGSLGGVMMLMFWLYISSLVLLVAGEVNKICYKAKEWCGHEISPAVAEKTAPQSGAENHSELSKGSPMSHDWKFCPRCGQALTPGAEAGQDLPSCLNCLGAGQVSPVDKAPSKRTASGGDQGDKSGPSWEPIGPTGFGC